MNHPRPTAREFGLRLIAGICGLMALGLSIYAVIVATRVGVFPERLWLVRWAHFGGMAAIFSWRAIRGRGSLPFVFGMLAAAWLFDSVGVVSAILVSLAGLCLLAIALERLKPGAAEPRVAADRAAPGR